MRMLPLVATATLLSSCLFTAPISADPPEHFIFVKDAEVVLKSASATSITIKSDPVVPVNVSRTGVPTLGNPKAQPDQTLEFTSDCKVRLLKLPILRDDKGKQIFRTTEELDKLKGKSGLPGYEAEASDLKPNQTVRITIVKKASGDANKLYVRTAS